MTIVTKKGMHLVFNLENRHFNGLVLRPELSFSYEIRNEPPNGTISFTPEENTKS